MVALLVMKAVGLIHISLSTRYSPIHTSRPSSTSKCAYSGITAAITNTLTALVNMNTVSLFIPFVPLSYIRLFGELLVVQEMPLPSVQGR